MANKVAPLAATDGGFDMRVTKREYFAGCALEGLLAKGEWPHAYSVAKAAVLHADLLLEELNKRK